MKSAWLPAIDWPTLLQPPMLSEPGGRSHSAAQDGGRSSRHNASQAACSLTTLPSRNVYETCGPAS